jgi:two-component system, LytTR family, sensor kinase
MSPKFVSSLTSKLFLDGRYQFWSLQIAGWTSLAFLFYFNLTAISGPTDIAYVLHPGVQSIIGIFVSWPLRFVFRRTWDTPAANRLVINSIAVLFAAFVWTVLRLASFVWMTHEDKNFLPEFGNWYFPSILVFFGWATLYHGIKYFLLQQEEHEELMRLSEEKKAEELRRIQAEAIAKEAQLKMLRYQLNPHFLFNTLNAIASLVNSGRTENACRMIDDLSDFLRKSLASDPVKTVSLRKEIDTLKLYLDIEQTRFADRLRLQFDLDQSALDAQVPSLILQPLAENAIKYAIAPNENGGTIRVSARTAGNYVELRVEDDGPGFAAADNSIPSTGVGLRNSNERLQSLYGKDFELRLEANEPAGARVVLVLPFSGAGPAAEEPVKQAYG